MDLNEFFKKAMEEEMKPDEHNESKNIFDFISGSDFKPDESMKEMLSLLSSGKLIALGHTAVEKKAKIISELTDFLSNTNRTDKARWIADAGTRIEMAGKKLRILNIIISAATLSPSVSSVNDKEGYSNLIDAIVAMGML